MTDKVTCHVCHKDVPYEDITWVEGDLPYCLDCADGDDLDECPYCHQMRWKENLFEYIGDDKVYKHESLCIGCIEDVEDNLYYKKHGIGDYDGEDDE